MRVARHFTERNIDENDALALHLQSICNAFALKQSDLSPMNAKCEAMVDVVLTEYHYNGKEKTLKKYQDKVLVAEWKGDEAKEKWHEVID